MARYDLTNTFIKLNETSGVIENISNAPVEISSQSVRRTGIILYPQQRYMFSGTVYAAKESNSSSPAAIAVETNIPVGGSSSGSGIDYRNALNAISQTLQDIHTGIVNHSCCGGGAGSGDCLLGQDNNGIYMVLDDNGNPTNISVNAYVLGQDSGGIYGNITN